MSMTNGRSAGTVFPGVVVAAFTLAVLLPFIGKAFHIDDPVFIWSARQIQSHPLNFYGFTLNWDGREALMATLAPNPPLASYYLALVGSLFGWSEIALHGGFLLPALAVVLGTYKLAQRFGTNPVATALVTITAPVFLLTSTSVMCDTMMLAFWVWSVFFLGGRRSATELLAMGSSGIADRRVQPHEVFRDVVDPTSADVLAAGAAKSWLGIDVSLVPDSCLALLPMDYTHAVWTGIAFGCGRVCDALSRRRRTPFEVAVRTGFWRWVHDHSVAGGTIAMETRSVAGELGPIGRAGRTGTGRGEDRRF
jgi:hypothetical protein